MLSVKEVSKLSIVLSAYCIQMSQLKIYTQYKDESFISTQLFKNDLDIVSKFPLNIPDILQSYKYMVHVMYYLVF